MADQKEYSLGVVPQFDSRRIVAIWQPIINKIHRETGIKLHLLGAPDIPSFEKAFQEGEYDFAYMNPYHAVIAHRKQGYDPIISDTRHKLFGIIVVRKSSPIKTIQDLKDKTVAFPAPNALGASLIPRAEFDSRFGIKITPKYVKSHGSVYLNVLLNQADAGGGVQSTLQKQPPAVRNQLRVLYETKRVNPHPIVVHPRVEKSTVEQVKDILIKMSSQSEGHRLLANIPITEAGATSIDAYTPLMELGLEKYYVQ